MNKLTRIIVQLKCYSEMKPKNLEKLDHLPISLKRQLIELVAKLKHKFLFPKRSSVGLMQAPATAC